MSTKFMVGTLLAQTETEMQRIPGFRPRKSGMVISRFSYTPADCGCIQKAEKKNGGSPTGSICPRERFAAGCAPLNELLERMTAEIDAGPFSARVQRLSARDTPFFNSDQHYRRFWKLWEANQTTTDEAALCAAVYLLSADTFLWGKSVVAIRPDIIDFPAIRIHGVDLSGYVLFHTARDLYKGTRHISLSELTDPELVSDWLFRLIVNGFLIRRYGACVIQKAMEEKECCKYI